MHEEDPSSGVLTWNSTEGQEYEIYFSPDLNSPFETLVKTVPSEGDGRTSAIVKLSGKRGFFIIRTAD